LIRVYGSRWPGITSKVNRKEKATAITTVYELCYTVRLLVGDWGLVSLSMIVTSRFILRNDSKKIGFLLKQCGTMDETAGEVSPGHKSSFHWSDYRLPELIDIRPNVKHQGRYCYRWSGGFDPLSIGSTPLRIRRARDGAIVPK
jgi:SHR-binding domain of vacuolar-sorting associated protein 13